ncbi:MAG: lipoprotein-releasing system ATP-binding protein LolD [Desulfobacter postgatei]|uniref:Lipoprotein-releasing system ATP-binding protein LolD n=1 Tax=Desulfobacter postgatei TaxID=2293 RepID=A0A2G6MRL3_9BACT|nr:MAG: lipoprotein-releasing system ATP-binding protein LolD [Desulfobacter postgatei]
MDDTPLIQLNGVSRSFVSKTTALEILHKADLSIQQGETIAILGASGIGKSTLLNIIGTLDKPDEGRLLFHGEQILGYDDEKLAAFRNKHIGFVFQFHYLLQGFTAVENVMLPGLISGKSKKTIEKHAVNMLERVELGARVEYRVEDLSGGEQQRVAIARALVMAPALLLADEPTGNLDQKNSHAVHQLLKELNQEMGMTIIVVTHNSDLAGLMGRRLTLKDGKIVPHTE